MVKISIYQHRGFGIYAGIAIVLALVLGGGTQQHLWTDQVIKIFMLPVALAGFANIVNNRLGHVARFLVFVILAILVIQFIPVGLNQKLPSLDGVTPNWQFLTATPYNGLDAATTTLTMLGVGLYVSTLADFNQMRLVRYIVLGFFINVLVSVIQLSFPADVEIEGVLAYTINSGMFANENHFSTLIFTMIPLLAWRYIDVSKNYLMYFLLTALTLALLFAVGSRAGMALSSILALVCLGWFGTKNTSPKFKIFGLAIVVAVIVIGYFNLDVYAAFQKDLRGEFAWNTWLIFKQHWLLGTGLGSFVLIYPIYDPSQNIIETYVNHAHNDYIELMLEIGIVAVPAIALYIGLIISNMFRSGLAQAAGISIVAILVHSSVEYPLRTTAILTVFTVFSAIILSKNQKDAPVKSKRKARQSTPDIQVIDHQ